MQIWYFEYNPYSRVWMAHGHTKPMLSSIIWELTEEMALALIDNEKAQKVHKFNAAAIFPDSTHNGDERYCWMWESSEIPTTALLPWKK